LVKVKNSFSFTLWLAAGAGVKKTNKDKVTGKKDSIHLVFVNRNSCESHFILLVPFNIE
jgi:hypothetical protein